MGTDQDDILLAQLKLMSPMPEDDLLSEDSLRAYEQIVEDLDELSDPRAINSLIDSFGYGTGYGLYESVVALIERLSPHENPPYLFSALRNGERGSRKWAARLLGRSRDRAAVPHLLDQLHDSEELVRAEVVKALGMIGDASVRPQIEQLQRDPSPIVRRAVVQTLTHLKVSIEM